MFTVAFAVFFVYAVSYAAYTKGMDDGIDVGQKINIARLEKVKKCTHS